MHTNIRYFLVLFCCCWLYFYFLLYDLQRFHYYCLICYGKLLKCWFSATACFNRGLNLTSAQKFLFFKNISLSGRLADIPDFQDARFLLKMFDDPFTEFIAYAALIFTVLQFLTGVSICLQIKQKGSTVDISVFPFISGIFNCSLWLKYGLLIGDQTLTIVNAIGLALQLLYTTFYYTFTYNKTVLHRQLLAVFGTLIPILAYLKFMIPDLATASSQAGLVACVAGIMFFASPLGGLAVVLRTKSTETLPLPLIVSTFVGTLLWYTYGLLTDNFFIQVPNIIGVGIAVLELLLFLIFPRKSISSPLILKD